MNDKFNDFSKNLTAAIGSTGSLIIHTIFFIGIFGLRFLGFDTSSILLILTTAVSLEAIYLSIFIQITVNRQSEELEEVSEDIEEIQKDVDEIQEDVDEIQKDVDEIQEDVEEISEDEEEERHEQIENEKFKNIENTLTLLMHEIEGLKKPIKVKAQPKIKKVAVKVKKYKKKKPATPKTR
ncbi:MAG: DUF1003 domain-containing protein [Patescibacteria group bacterium]|nr:DUF1003 domain-containing protein [Patescibacteria group bacterium]